MTSTDENRLLIRPVNRSAWRNTHIYASDDRDTALGGLWVAEGITNTYLYSMVEIFCIFTDTFGLQDDSGRLVGRDEQPLRPGNYYIITNGSITITDEAPLLRTISLHTGTRVESFIHSVRDRDRRCIITGRSAVMAGVSFWENFEAVHVFPLAYEENWNNDNFSQWITVPPDSESHGTINSVQNGMLLTLDMHAMFESYQISINPDDDHRVVCFTPYASSYGITSAHLDQRFLNNPLRPVDQLLRWHFRQAVLVNMKGTGEPCFEMDLPPGSDIIGQIMSGPKAKERMEFELFSRFNAQGFTRKAKLGSQVMCI
ncbi:hypothetical protein B9Z19DRAFT_1089387 [Tuber borchii]|uniref:Uncharacterized protein n=1 Tax=Tuber borchii TaxID=42251 RepID=A0A2T6ZK56_TUBBO|nr:hypothetical protein B9Z19DRAFT_1089387 [Tuber borchii]